MFIPDSAVYRRSRSPIPPLFKRPRRSYAQPSLTLHVGTLTAPHTWTKVDLHGPIGPRTTVVRPSFRTAREPALRTCWSPPRPRGGSERRAMSR